MLNDILTNKHFNSDVDIVSKKYVCKLSYLLNFSKQWTETKLVSTDIKNTGNQIEINHLDNCNKKNWVLRNWQVSC